MDGLIVKSVIQETLQRYKGMLLDDETTALMVADIMVSVELAKTRVSSVQDELQVPISVSRPPLPIAVPSSSTPSPRSVSVPASPASARIDPSSVSPTQVGQILWLHRRFTQELEIPWSQWLDHTERTKVWADEAAIVSGINSSLIIAIVVPHLGRRKVVTMEAWAKLGEVLEKLMESMTDADRLVLIQMGRDSLGDLI